MSGVNPRSEIGRGDDRDPVRIRTGHELTVFRTRPFRTRDAPRRTERPALRCELMSRCACALLLGALITAATGGRAALADDGPAGTGATGPASTAAAGSDQPVTPPYGRALPFMAEEAIKRGYELPLPYGAALIVTGLGNRKIDVTDVRVGLESPPRSVSQFVQLGSSSNVINANVKFDAWVLPFLNVYALVGVVRNTSVTHAVVTVPAPGPGTGTLQFTKDVTTDLSGVVGGGGVTIATGYRQFFVVVDASYVQSDLGFDNAFNALIATVRTGWNGRIGTIPLQLWLGVGNWDTAATATGHVDLENAGRLDFAADQKPHTPWMYDVGTNLQFSKRWQLVLDVGSDFQGGYFAVVGPTYRF